MGIKDLDYQGNVFVPEWKGCPDEVLRKLRAHARYDAARGMTCTMTTEDVERLLERPVCHHCGVDEGR